MSKQSGCTYTKDAKPSPNHPARLQRRPWPKYSQSTHALSAFTTQRHKPLRRGYGNRLGSRAGAGCYRGGRGRVYIDGSTPTPDSARSTHAPSLPLFPILVHTKVISKDCENIGKTTEEGEERKVFYFLHPLSPFPIRIVKDVSVPEKVVNIDFSPSLPIFILG